MNSEDLYGPDYRVTIEKNGVARLVPSEWPVLSVTQAEYALAAGFPPVFTVLPSTAVQISQRLTGVAGVGAAFGQGVGPSEIRIAPGVITWGSGRNGYLLRLSYVAGWPHAGLAAATGTALTNLVQVDDCTGFAANGISTPATIYDGVSTESVTVTSASASSGPGTLTLAGNLLFQHAAGVPLTTMPPVIQQAVIMFASAEAFERGATAITVPSLPGAETGQGGFDSEKLRDDARKMLHPFRRVL